ncbi:hypothetical protein [Dyadobacter aurulentus]|uniref:hypothetical protein n=1 Tax=Dyadobacter sp. UC 10 TaxID=2605428 RepID=UPI0012568BD4|nr:hypothetical protein [Dyadobacter sp. UC 10]KAA0990467.1 hypothetical protein FXO21_10025 [Dyadobacter sp. UC 10]
MSASMTVKICLRSASDILETSCIFIEDRGGLKEDALYALRELISNQVLHSSVTAFALLQNMYLILKQ